MTAPAVGEPDPIIAAVAAFEEGLRIYGSEPRPADNSDAYIWADPMAVLVAWKQPCVTRDGAVAAMRLAVKEIEEYTESDELLMVMMRAVLAYLEGGAA